MSIKSTKRQVQGDKTYSAAIAPIAPIVSSYTISGTDDTALDPAGGQTILLKGVGFKPGATIMLGLTAIGVVSYVDTNTLSFTSPANSAGTYSVYVTNVDNGTGILTPGIVYSTFPTWTTSEGTQGSYYETQSINKSFVATSDSPVTTYELYSGTLPTGSTLASDGTLTGTAPVDSGSTTYQFTLKAIDSELQESTRLFSLTINTDVVTWNSPADNTGYVLVGNSAMADVTLSATSAAGYNVTYQANALPTGTSLVNGVISGTPTVAETVSTLLTATAATTNRTATRTISWTISLGDTYWKNVSLLLNGSTPTTTFINDASLNNSQLTIAGDTKPNNFNPYEHGYYSFNYDTKTDYVSIPSTPSITTFTGNFTIECWVYPTDITLTETWGVLDTRTNGASAAAWLFGLGGPYSSGWLSTFFDGTTYLGTTRVQANCWTHLAWVRSSTTVTFFVNGVAGGTFEKPGTLTGGNSVVYVGTKDNGISGFGNVGYISNLRIVNGTALYTTTFTPSTTPLTAIANTTLLIANSNSYKDISLVNNVLTNGSTSISPANPFSAPTIVAYNTQYSTYFDGTGDYLSLASAITYTGDFTIEAWIFNSNSSITNYAGVVGGASGAFVPMYVYANKMECGIWGSSGIVTSTGTITPGQWNHVALVRSGSTMRWYINGTQDSATATNSSTLTQNSPNIGSSPSVSWTGNISNVRITRGVAVYTGNFTVPTSPLTATQSSGTNISAITGTSTYLLTCQNSTLIDNSTNNLTIISAADAKPVAVSPFTMTTSNTTVTSLGSAYFDGTGDWLNIPYSAAFSTGATYTFEAWVYPTVLNSGNMIFQITNTTVGNFGGWLFELNAAGEMVFNCRPGNGGTNVSIYAGLVPKNAWTHVALVVNNNAVKIFQNGIQVNTGTVAALDGTQNFVAIGAITNGYTAVPFTGHIVDARLIKGTALYTANFLPPQTPLTPVTNTQLLTCQYNGGANNNGFVDQSSFNNIITRSGNTTQGTFSPYSQNGWSNYFDGNGDYLSLPGTSSNFGTSDFTIELWVYTTGSGASAITNCDGGTDLNYFAIDAGTTQTLIQIRDSSSQAYAYGAGVTLNTWTHIAVSRLSGSVTVFVNGQPGTPVSITKTVTNRATIVGGFLYTGFLSYFNGYISNVRVIKGTALYTTNFTPSTTPLTAVTKTSILTCQDNRLIDKSATNFAVTKAGDVSVQAFSPFGGATSVPTSYSTYFDGSTGFLTATTGTAFPIGTESFTVEMFIYKNNAWNNNNQVLLISGTSGSLQLWIDSSVPSIKASFNSGATPLSYSTSSLSLNTWYHLAVTRSGNNFTMYINGTSVTTGTDSGSFATPTSIVIGNFSSGTSNIWNGFISNLRIVRGTAITPPAGGPTSHLTAVSGTSLLTCQSNTMIDNRTNNFAITANGNATPRPFNPFGDTTTTGVSYSPSVNGGSMYFDGSGDYLTLAPGVTFGTNAFTIEFWVYFESAVWTSSAYNPIFVSTSVNNGLSLLINSGTGVILQLDCRNVSNQQFTIPAPAVQGWTHIAVVRNSSNATTAFVNGVRSSTGAVTVSTNYSGATTLVGYTSGAILFKGYMSDLKMTAGVALYDPNQPGFYPPVAPVTPTTTLVTTTYNSNLLLSGTSGGIIDYHGTNDLETVGNTQLISEDPYGGSYYSNYFDGTGDSLSIAANSVFNLTGDFTVELWVYMASIYPGSSDDGWGGPSFLTMTNGGNAGSISGDLFFGLARSSNGAAPGIWQFSGVSGGNNFGNVNIQYADVAPAAGKWYHLAMSRSGTSVKAFLDGKLAGSATSSAAFGSSTHNLYVGLVDYTYARYLNGNISNVRIINGTALYTTSSTTNGTQVFTPSTTPLTAVANTKLLTCQSNTFKDNSTNNFTITRNGDTKVKSFNPFQQNTGKSLYFDGDDSILIRKNPALPLTGNFTVECWIYMTALNSNNMILGGDNGANSDYLNVTSSSINMAINGGLTYPSWSYTFTTGRWYYVAITRTGTSMNAYINGVAQTAQTYAQQFIQTDVNLYIGRYGYSTPWYFTGYIKDLRITKGVTRTITVPTEPNQLK